MSLDALRDLADHLSANDPALSARIADRFETAVAQIKDLDDPAFQGVADPQSRLRIEIIQQSIDAIRTTVQDELGPILGVAAGFNSLDGD